MSAVNDNAHSFLSFALDCGVLRFGEFTLKSGRLSPYFFNAGLFDSGAKLARLGRFYARAIVDSGVAFDMLFGPAYKGIPLATAVAIALAGEHGRDVPVTYNRKEAKTHGEGGALIGAPLNGRVLIVDDVITAGTAVRESVALIGAAGAQLAGVVISFDREERGQGTDSAVREVERTLAAPVIRIATLSDLVGFAASQRDLAAALPAIEAYRKRYGA